jgi:Protein of unknown function (DUF4089)
MTRRSTGREAKTARNGNLRARPLAAAKSAKRSAKTTDGMAALVAAAARELALPIDPAWQAGVKVNLRLLFKHAALVDALSLPDEVQPAPVFRA